jgi:tRNA A-37 threonylcarbamoyl transferase component Bud32
MPPEARPQTTPAQTPAASMTPEMTPERWRAVDAVVRGALALPPDARAAFVADACTDDARLRREVEELLAVRTGDVLARPAAAAFADAAGEAMLARVSAALAGRYVVEREIGRGGMATVYLARDQRHERRVAVKVLHPELAAVVGAARFLSEIRTTAALQHPHVLPLFDSGSTGTESGLLYYVMPFVDGETLRARLARERQLPLADAVRIATEVAGALEYAHRRGVIHRDVKPENVLLGEDGQALVADFGIALAVRQAAGERLTQSGLSLGTPQYMAPEQALGEKTIDARADVYALGAVTYEMLAGEPPFTGPSAQAIVARVMTESPRTLGAQRPSVPPHVEAAVRTALETLPADRFASAAAFAAALAAPAPSARHLGRALSAPTRSRRLAPMMAALATAVLAVGAAFEWGARRGAARESAGRGPASERGPVRFAIQLDSGSLDFGSGPVISPDGRTVVYAADAPDGPRLYARRLDQLVAQPIPGTEDGTLPFLSPDGAWVGFFSHGALRKTRLDGGTSLVVTAAPSMTYPSRWDCGWGKDDVILCSGSGASSGGLIRRAPHAPPASTPERGPRHHRRRRESQRRAGRRAGPRHGPRTPVRSRAGAALRRGSRRVRERQRRAASTALRPRSAGTDRPARADRQRSRRVRPRSHGVRRLRDRHARLPPGGLGVGELQADPDRSRGTPAARHPVTRPIRATLLAGRPPCRIWRDRAGRTRQRRLGHRPRGRHDAAADRRPPGREQPAVESGRESDRLLRELLRPRVHGEEPGHPDARRRGRAPADAPAGYAVAE